MRAPVTRPSLLDLYSGAGGAAIGYDRAGFDVTGVTRPTLFDYLAQRIEELVAETIASFDVRDAIMKEEPRG
jgi:site-specific DNA-cytosine methylase